MENGMTKEVAADIAAVTALLEIGEEIGVSPLLANGAPFTIAEVAATGEVPERGAELYVEALLAAGLLEETNDPEKFTTGADFIKRRHEAGYLSWSLNANRPFIDNAKEFLNDPQLAAKKYQRDGRRVAFSSAWMSAHSLYGMSRSEIIKDNPAKVVDLGAGAGALVIDVLGRLPSSTGVVVDMSGAALQAAQASAARAGVDKRLSVYNRRIESLVDDPSPLDGANVINASFVMHDLFGDPDGFQQVLRTCRKSLAPGGRFIITDAVPYSEHPHERKFSALFSYFHAGFMDVRLPTEAQWEGAFREAGYANVDRNPIEFPGGRMFVISG